MWDEVFASMILSLCFFYHEKLETLYLVVEGLCCLIVLKIQARGEYWVESSGKDCYFCSCLDICVLPTLVYLVVVGVFHIRH